MTERESTRRSTAPSFPVVAAGLLGGKSVGEAARVALGRIAQMSNSAETEEHLMEFNSLIQLHADGVSLPYQVLFSALDVR